MVHLYLCSTARICIMATHHSIVPADMHITMSMSAVVLLFYSFPTYIFTIYADLEASSSLTSSQKHFNSIATCVQQPQYPLWLHITP